MDSTDVLNSTDVEALKQYYTSQATSGVTDFDLFIVLPIIIIGFLFVIAYIALNIIAMWQLFKKADEKPWKAFIPVYNLYMLAKISNRIKSFWVALILLVIGAVFSAITQYTDDEIILVIFSILNLGAQVAVFVFTIFILNGISHAFGHGNGYTVGLVFLEVIFLCILALGKSKYTPEAVFDK